MQNYETTCYSWFGNISHTGGESHWVMKDIRLTVGLIYFLGSRTSKPFARYSSQKVHPVVSCESGWSQVNVELMLTSETIMLCHLKMEQHSPRVKYIRTPCPSVGLKCQFGGSIFNDEVHLSLQPQNVCVFETVFQTRHSHAASFHWSMQTL